MILYIENAKESIQKNLSDPRLLAATRETRATKTQRSQKIN